jgi:hypothetical protein
MASGAISRRRFLGGAAAGAAGAAVFTIVPRHVLGGPAQAPPSETLGGALIGCGGRGGGTFGGLGKGVRRLASCDVKFLDRADNQTVYADFRRVLERKDIDVVAIATHPGWHALISIAAMPRAGPSSRPRTATTASSRSAPTAATAPSGTATPF